MTSSDLSLGQALKIFNLGLSVNQETATFLTKHASKAKQFLHQNKIQEHRRQQNLVEKEMIKLNVQRYVKGWKFGQTLPNPDLMLRYIDYYFEVNGMTLNTSAFLNTIQLLGDEQQVKFWRDQIVNGRAFGGYIQTQLGHGSNVQGLETEAHYDEKTQQFTINSPSVRSAKFWPGVLGLFSTHALMQAQTYVKGKSIGLQTFVIQIRDDKLNLLQNVEAGDIGPKIGFTKVDNGFLQLKNIKAPRRAMLMKYIQLQSNGEVIGLENKQAIKYGYGSMLYLRVKLVYGFSFGYILTPVRQLSLIYQKMGVINQDSKRKQLIYYFCMGQGLLLSNLDVLKLYNKFTSELNAKNYKKADKLLIKCHIISSTFKALAGWKALEISREVCSKNIFTLLKASNIPKSFVDSIPTVTYQGDNTVLLQQTAKFILMKQKKAKNMQVPTKRIKDDNMAGILSILQYVCSMQISRIQAIMKDEFQKGTTINVLWNEKYQRQIIEVSKLWGYMNLVQSCLQTISNIAQFKQLFEKVCKIYIKGLLQQTSQIEQTDTWRLISQQQFEALDSFSRLTADNREPQDIYSRQGNWTRASL